MTLRTVRSRDGTPIAVHVSGAGPAMVLVHGSAADHTDWDLVKPAFEAHFEVHRLDRRGRGRSGDGPSYALAREAEDVAAVVESCEGPVVLFGQSLGALVALEAAIRTSRVSKLVLYEPPFFPAGEGPVDVAASLEKLLDAGDLEGVAVAFHRDAVGLPEEVIDQFREMPELWGPVMASARTLPRELRADAEYVFEPVRFAKLATPTLLLSGTESPPFFGAAVDAVHRAVRGSRVENLDGQGHGALMEAPAMVAEKVLAFVR